MAYQQVRANFPKNGDGNVREPGFCQLVDALGNLTTPDSGLIPQGGVGVSASSGNVANAIAAATLAASAGVTNYISGFEISGSGATAASVVTVTVTGLLGGTQSYTLAVVAGAALGNPMLAVQFAPPFPASAVNTAITVSCPALGAGNTNNVANVRGVRV